MNDTWPKSRIQKGGSLEARVWLSRLNWSRASEGKWKYEKLVGEDYPATRGTMREQRADRRVNPGRVGAEELDKVRQTQQTGERTERKPVEIRGLQGIQQ